MFLDSLSEGKQKLPGVNGIIGDHNCLQIKSGNKQWEKSE